MLDAEDEFEQEGAVSPKQVDDDEDDESFAYSLHQVPVNQVFLSKISTRIANAFFFLRIRPIV